MDSVVSYDKMQDEVDLIERNSMNNYFAKRFVNGKLTMKQILIGLFVVLVIGVVILIGLMHSEKYSPSSLQVFSLTKDGMEGKRQFVREMMLDSWNAYERYAWGYDELLPVSKKAFNSKSSLGEFSGFSLVTSMSTLWTMELKDEFEKGKKWIETKLDCKKWSTTVHVYDVIVNYVGGLLSCYALTEDRMFLDKAKEFGQLVEPAFNTSTGVPFTDFALGIGNANGHFFRTTFTNGFQVDFNYLSAVTGEPKYRNQIEKLHKIFKDIEEPKNLYARWINVNKYYLDSFADRDFGVARELFFSFVKSYIQSNYHDVLPMELYKEALEAFEAVKILDVDAYGRSYVRGYDNRTDRYSEYMHFTNCDFGAMLSLGAVAMQQALNKSLAHSETTRELHQIHSDYDLAERITETCQQISLRTKTGLAPHMFSFFRKGQMVQLLLRTDKSYYLSHELAESNFILWRLTHNEKYRDNAWQMAQAIHKHCRVESGGYSGVVEVNQVPTDKNDLQSPIFLSATLKYLYLTFTDDTVLPLDQFVFNSVGHPLPICGNNTMYPADMCKF